MTTIANPGVDTAAHADTFPMEGLLTQSAVINNGVGASITDILGWNYIFQGEDGHCYKFYAAQPPLIGSTRPTQISSPLGIQLIKECKVDCAEAIRIMHTMNGGDKFVAISLAWPLIPECNEPYWHIRTTLDNTIAIGANSGKAS